MVFLIFLEFLYNVSNYFYSFLLKRISLCKIIFTWNILILNWTVTEVFLCICGWLALGVIHRGSSTWCPQRVLSFTLLGKSSCEDQTVFQVNCSGSFVALVCQGLLLNLTGSWIHSSDLSILASEQNLWSVPVPASGVDQIRQGYAFQSFSSPNIPDDNL